MGLLEKSDEEILQVAVPIMDNLMEGASEGNWEKHTRDFVDANKQELTESELERQRSEYRPEFGDFARRELVGITRHPEYVNVIWRQEMTIAKGEFLAILTLVQDGERYLVARCWVDLWEPKGKSS